jgi:hypothetical protein
MIKNLFAFKTFELLHTGPAHALELNHCSTDARRLSFLLADHRDNLTSRKRLKYTGKLLFDANSK